MTLKGAVILIGSCKIFDVSHNIKEVFCLSGDQGPFDTNRSFQTQHKWISYPMYAKGRF